MTRSLKLLPAIVALLALVMCAPLARADDASELERAKASYDAGRYGEGVERFRQLLSQDSPNALRDPVAIERARAYYAACLIALDRNNEADAQIEAIIRADPLYTPDPVVFPGKVVNRVLDIKTRLKVEIERAVQQRADVERAKKQKQEQEQQAYIDALQQQAGQESVVVRHSRWIAALPFGVGQFQNGQEALGYAFLASETLLAGTSIVSGFTYMELITQYTQSPPGSVNFDDFNSRQKTARDVSRATFALWALVAVGGVVHAQLTFIPEVHETRPRPLPKPPAVMPSAFGMASGFGVGIAGAF